MYKIAQEKFTEKSPGFWLGIEDIENEGVFKYTSNNQSLLGEWEARLPWAPNQPNGGKKENCLTGMRFRWYDYDCSKIAWSICESTSAKKAGPMTCSSPSRPPCKRALKSPITKVYSAV